MSLMWLGDEKPKAQIGPELTPQQRAKLQRAEAYAWVVILVVAIAFTMGLIIGSYYHAPH